MQEIHPLSSIHFKDVGNLLGEEEKTILLEIGHHLYRLLGDVT
jgi:hypothetical protein